MEIVTRYFSGFTEEQLAQFAGLESLYTQWNARINVISRKDIGSLYEKHVLHSLSLAAVFNFRRGSRVIDIGTGGGFPGIPLAIFFPETHFHLVDSIGKKLNVVDAVSESLGLKNVSTRHIRAEEIQERKFDVAVSRAVAPLKDLWAWSKALLKNQPPPKGVDGSAEGLPFAGGLICLKGGDLAMEISESNTRPKIREIYPLFPEEVFRGKYIVQLR
ncbi:MAG TPA: 16S rRNA (guanine(527)-N(7))-methyltransferase RsmG [Puia sp.]